MALSTCSSTWCAWLTLPGPNIIKLEAQASPGVTDAADLLVDKDEQFPFIMFGPGNVSQAHQVDEHVDKAIYLSFVKLFSEMFPTWGTFR